MADSLYGFVAEGAPHFSASLILCTNPILPGQVYTYADLVQPTIQGYSRLEEETVSHFLRDKFIEPGKRALLTVGNVFWTNKTDIQVFITGAALIIHKDRFTPLVAALVPKAAYWKPQERFGLVMWITAAIHDEV